MQLWTFLLLRGLCLACFVVLVVIQSGRSGSRFVVDGATVSRQYRPMSAVVAGSSKINNNNIRSGRVLNKPPPSSNGIIFADHDETDECEQLPDEELGQILGPAYNSRYMSIKVPQQRQSSLGSGASSKKRGTGEEQDELLFAVDDTFAHELSDQPAWATPGNHAAMDEEEDEQQQQQQTAGKEHRRRRRSLGGSGGAAEASDPEEANREQRDTGGGSASGQKRPWECDMRIKWTDLGQDYFPRFLRTVECAKRRCFYGRYTCQARSFTVKLLRRRRGQCVRIGSRNATMTTTTSRPEYKRGVEGLPVGLRELWVWEERAVNFCCDCAAVANRY